MGDTRLDLCRAGKRWGLLNRVRGTWFAAGGEGQGVDDGHENAAGASGGGWHGGGDEGLGGAQPVRQPQGALAEQLDKNGGHPLAQPRLLEALRGNLYF